MLQRWLKRGFYFITIFTVIVAIISVLLYTAFVRTIRAQDYAHIENWPLYQWATVDLSDKAVCADGSDYRFYAQRGESNNLIIHFSGGGACWNDETCSKPIQLNNLSGYYFSYIWEIRRALLSGIFQHDNPDNPFRDWNIAYIPYCTADLHLGTATQTYVLQDGGSITVRHNGRQNVTEALAWIDDTFSQPEKLLISGDSAGGWASALWTPAIADHYPASDIYQLADSAFISTPRWAEFLDQVWEAEPLNFKVGDNLIGDAYRHYAENPAANVTYLHINTLYDSVIIGYAARMNAVTDVNRYREIWSSAMRESMQGVAASGLDYHYYLTDYGLDPQTGGTPHTSISDSLFFSMEEDHVFLHDWLRRIVLNGERFSVGSSLLRKP